LKPLLEEKESQMPDTSAVVAAADQLAKRDEAALELLIGLRAAAIEKDPSLADDVNLEPHYEATLMGPLEDIKSLGRRILNRWNKELHDIVCGNEKTDKTDRQAILNSLNLGEAAVIAAVATALLSLGVVAALAAVLAPLIVKRFIWPAKEELCDAWGDALHANG
jgi:hypothetical protein